MAKKRATLTDLLNDLTFKTIYDKYRMICLNMFEWSGLPDGIKERHIETVLFEQGRAIFFRDPDMSYMCLPTFEGSRLNVYGDPLSWRAVGLNYQREYDADDCVIISNNKPRIATHDFVMFYANKLTEAERTMDVNVKANKTPYVFACDANDLLTFKAIFAKIDGNEPAIFADKKLTADAIKVFQTGVKFLCNELMDYKHGVESDFLTFLGVNNVGVDKKERLITDEAQANDELIASFLDLQLQARQEACTEINALYGLNVTVKARQSSSYQKEGVENVENLAV